MTRLVIYPDNTFELLPDEPPRRGRRLRPLEVAAYLVATILISGIGLLILPFVITVLGAVAPFAAIGWFLCWAWRRRRLVVDASTETVSLRAGCGRLREFSSRRRRLNR